MNTPTNAKAAEAGTAPGKNGDPARARWVAEQVAKAPPLTGGRRDRLVELLAGAR